MGAKNKTRLSKEMEIARLAKEQVGSWTFLSSIDVQKSLLAMLYWAEGQKLPDRLAYVKFANTDPKMVLFFLTMLRNCYKLDENRLKIRLYVHWYHNVPKLIKFWSDLLGVDPSRFYRSYLKRRSPGKKFRKNFVGICFVYYFSVDLRREIMDTAYNIGRLVSENHPRASLA